eukprot:PITA_08141
MEVGAENVVQVITDSASNYVAAGKMLEEKHPTIWWSPCAAHCLDLMLEDIGKIEWVKKCVEDAKSITRYIYNHSWVLNFMRKHTGGKELVRSAITRFATNFLLLQSLIQQKTNLRKMFSCDKWNSSQWSKKAEGKQMVDQVFDKKNWSKIEEIVLFSELLVRVLWMVDSDKFAMGFVYEAMDQAKEQIKGAHGDKRQNYIPLWRIIYERWNKQLHRPLHPIGGNNLVVNAINCKTIATRILSQTCSASGCERNWSVFERIHTQKRNCLEQKRLNDMAFVQYNLRLKHNQLLNKTPETSNIVLGDFGPTSE